LQSPQKLTQFDDVPVKAASVAQVHLAQWDGQDAVVKIVRSKVRQTYEADLDIMVMLAEKVNSSNEARGIHPMLSAVAARLKRLVVEETDMRSEARNQAVLGEELTKLHDLNIVVAKAQPSKVNGARRARDESMVLCLLCSRCVMQGI
jgi:predicted unusual protein kinase regulating ubiquinone biosynthesis (AarF/ABC1/UbiB family)